MKFVATIILCLFALLLVGQSPERSLHDYIQRFQEHSEAKFSYDTEILSEIKLSKKQWSDDAGAFLKSLNNNFPLDIDTVNEAYYVIKLAETVYSTTATDSISREKIPPQFISILLNGQAVTGSRNDESSFFNYKPSQTDTIYFYAIGYKPKIIPWISLIQSTQLQFILSPAFIQLEDVTIHDYLTTGIDLNPANQSITIDVGALPLLPGETDGDLFASLAALPGISTPDNRPGNLFIRGSSTDQSYIMMDNIPIYSKGHYFGTISPYNPKVVDKVEVHRNGFHPRLGGRVGGAIEIKTDEVTASKPIGGIGANTLFAMGFAKVPLAKRKAGLSIGARRSFPSSFLSPKLSAITEMVYTGSAIMGNTSIDLKDVNVVFEDYQLGLTINPNAKNHMSISGFFTKSKIDYLVEMPNTEPTPDESNNRNIGISGSWRRNINENISSDLNFSFSSYALNFLSGDAVRSAPSPELNGTYSINTIDDLSISEELNWKLSSGVQMDLGVEYRRQYVYDNYKGPALMNQTFIGTNDDAANMLSPFMSIKFNQWEKWYVQVGGRINYYDLSNDVDIAPRIFTSWYLTNALTLKGSLGLYYQYLSQIKVLEFSMGGFDNELWRLANGADTQPIEGVQSMIGSVWNKSDWIIDVEAYFKTAQNVNYYSIILLGADGIFYQNDHKSFGVDFLIRKKINAHLESWMGYSYTQLSVITDTASYHSSYSQPHGINTGVTFHKDNWKISGGWRLASGLNGESLQIAQRIASYNAHPTRGGSAPEEPYADVNQRYPAVHFLDISASYTIPKTENRKWSSTFGLSLINVYNQKNLTDYVIRNSADSGNSMPGGRIFPVPVERYALNFAPNLMVTFEW